MFRGEKRLVEDDRATIDGVQEKMHLVKKKAHELLLHWVQQEKNRQTENLAKSMQSTRATLVSRTPEPTPTHLSRSRPILGSDNTEFITPQQAATISATPKFESDDKRWQDIVRRLKEVSNFKEASYFKGKIESYIILYVSNWPIFAIKVSTKQTKNLVKNECDFKYDFFVFISFILLLFLLFFLLVLFLLLFLLFFLLVLFLLLFYYFVGSQFRFRFYTCMLKYYIMQIMSKL